MKHFASDLRNGRHIQCHIKKVRRKNWNLGCYGHLSHIWNGTLELARAQNLKVTATHDLLQLLDMSFFKALKGYWGDILFRRMKMVRSHLSKAEFATYICDSEVWDKAFSKENIINGFRHCGISPCYRTQYPANRFHVNL